MLSDNVDHEAPVVTVTIGNVVVVVAVDAYMPGCHIRREAKDQDQSRRLTSSTLTRIPGNAATAILILTIRVSRSGITGSYLAATVRTIRTAAYRCSIVFWERDAGFASSTTAVGVSNRCTAVSPSGALICPFG